ncbi:hypothetical protein JTB14_009936 [Gonioctena quinquepunctata]|nr:hypothetical protein JTB14_009936 [Gonioctena quinquepunctata]
MVVTSTTEAEIVAANEATEEMIWLSRLFEGNIGLKHVPILQVDNSAAVRLAQNPEFQSNISPYERRFQKENWVFNKYPQKNRSPT